MKKAAVITMALLALFAVAAGAQDAPAELAGKIYLRGGETHEGAIQVAEFVLYRIVKRRFPNRAADTLHGDGVIVTELFGVPNLIIAHMQNIGIPRAAQIQPADA